MALVSVRRMRRADAAALCVMVKDLAKYHHGRAHVTAEALQNACLGARRLAQAWLAVSDGEVAGFAVVRDWMNFNRGYKVRHIDLLYVKEKFRRQGIGRALMQTALEDAQRQKFGRVDLGVAIKNRAAKKFYVELGFEVRDRKSFELCRYIRKK